MVKGLAQEAAERIVAERSRAPFTSLQEMVERCGLDRGAVSALAAADALQCFATNRYQAYWQAAGIEPRPPLFPALHFNEATPLLGRPGDMEDVIADYNSTGLSLKDHPVALLRSRFEALHVCRAVDLEKMGSESIWKNGVGVNFPIPRHFSFSRCHGKIDSDPIFPTPTPFSLIKVAGLIVCRQRPDTASGVMFMTLEDETGSVNLIVWPKVLERQRQPLLQGQLLLVQGTLQREEDVIHVVVGKAKDYSGWLAGLDVRSRNFADGIRTTRA
jgi:error-prone DNA polymerase